jgi:asparagine N-glycosylation enzyme membrane subunit Stt3
MALGVLLVCLALRARQEDFLNTLARVGPPLIPAALACGAATGCLAVFVTNAKPGQLPFFGGFNAGAAAIILSVLLVCLALITTGREFANVSAVVGVAHIPIAAVEGVVTGFLAVFLSKVKPELLEVGAAPAGGKESNDA